MNIYEKTSEILRYTAGIAKEGMTLQAIDELAGKKMAELNVVSAVLGYQPEWEKTPFPGHTCLSVNSVICHGLPTIYKLKQGDVLTIDLGIRDKELNLCGDAAITIGIGEIANKDQRLLRYAKRTMYEGIKLIRDGVKVTDLGRAMETYALQMNFHTNKAFSGHRIAEEMHMTPFIPNHYDLNPEYFEQFDGVLEEGMVVCIEPILSESDDRTGDKLKTGWLMVDRRGKNVAMFEHMVRVEKNGFTILTDHFEAE